MSAKAKRNLRFLQLFLRSPRSVGSVIPSSSHLAAAMVRPIDFSTVRSIVELGAGTGVFTERIAANLAPDAKGLVFEQDEPMRKMLEESYPDLAIHADARDMADIVRSLNGTGVDVVVSSLPFAAFPKELRTRLAQDIHDVLKPGGKLIACQYSTQMRRTFKELFQEVSISFVPLNVLPAFVYTCTKGA